MKIKPEHAATQKDAARIGAALWRAAHAVSAQAAPSATPTFYFSPREPGDDEDEDPDNIPTKLVITTADAWAFARGIFNAIDDAQESGDCMQLEFTGVGDWNTGPLDPTDPDAKVAALGPTPRPKAVVLPRSLLGTIEPLLTTVGVGTTERIAELVEQVKAGDEATEAFVTALIGFALRLARAGHVPSKATVPVRLPTPRTVSALLFAIDGVRRFSDYPRQADADDRVVLAPWSAFASTEQSVFLRRHPADGTIAALVFIDSSGAWSWWARSPGCGDARGAGGATPEAAQAEADVALRSMSWRLP